MKKLLVITTLLHLTFLSCSQDQANTAPMATAQSYSVENASLGSGDISEILENALGAVVTVAVYETLPANRQLGFRGGSTISEEAYRKALDLTGAAGSGSGFIIEYDGTPYVVTNAHVVENASDEEGSIAVFTFDRTKYNVQVVGGDSFYDIAVLAFVDQPSDDLKTLQFRESEPRIGERVYAIGNPGGEYPYTVTDGIISAKNRVRGGLTGKFGFLQTTATVIWGNSGGPLVDERGDVTGINSQIAFTSAPDGDAIWLSQINFALEAALSERLVGDIIENEGRVQRAYLGLELAQRYQMVEYPGGYGVKEIDERPVISGTILRSPASRCCGNLVGSTVVQINDQEVNNLEEALGILESLKPNTEVQITTEINGSRATQTINATLLATEELEQLAQHFLESIDEITVDYNAPYVSFTSTPNAFYEQQGRQYQKTQQPVNNRQQEFVMVAAGIRDQDHERMWMTTSLSDLAAALKLSGMNGVLDFYAIDPQRGGKRVIPFRKYLSDSEDIVQNTLWY